ncbi:MAG TPA: PilZ domain-containing protein [Acidobacteriaceae bacterium]|nr:PilZ domain-containing protein [Acidobacteriaceae bacterium]
MNESCEQFRLDPGNLEERSAVRFPLALPVHVIASDKFYEATTENISANGILFKLNEVLVPGTEVNFLIHVQAGTESSPETAAIHCLGRVVRAYQEDNQAHAAAVIDEYVFQNEEIGSSEE